MQAQTASEQGFVKGGNFVKLTSLPANSTFNIEGLPTFTEHEEYGVQATIPTNIGLVQTNNNQTVAHLQSTVNKSLGDLVRKSIKAGVALKVFVREEEANTGRTQKVISI